jgi:hypothetical protein
MRGFFKRRPTRIEQFRFSNVRGPRVSFAQVKPRWDFLNHNFGELLAFRLTVGCPQSKGEMRSEKSMPLKT